MEFATVKGKTIEFAERAHLFMGALFSRCEVVTYAITGVIALSLTLTADPDRAAWAWAAAGWGALSAASFVMGALLGVNGLVGTAIFRAALMAFGGGALLEAGAVEIFAHLLHEDHDTPGVGIVGILGGFFGIAFYARLAIHAAPRPFPPHLFCPSPL